jgi:uncharacterized membrane protein YjfL (UPF0719 family)
MRASTSLYWIRVALGVAIGAIDALYDYWVGILSASHSVSLDDFLAGLTFAILFFIVTYYILKIFYSNKFQKKSKIMSTGIGTYFIVWLVTWVLIVSVIKVEIVDVPTLLTSLFLPAR